MGELLKSSKFVGYLGMFFTLVGSGLTMYGSALKDKEMDLKVLHAVQDTIQKGFEKMGEVQNKI